MDADLLGPLGLAIGGGVGVLVTTLLKYLRKSTDTPKQPVPTQTAIANANGHADVDAKLDILLEDLKHRARDRAHDQMARHSAAQTAETVSSLTMSMQRQQAQIDRIERNLEEVLSILHRR